MVKKYILILIALLILLFNACTASTAEDVTYHPAEIITTQTLTNDTTRVVYQYDENWNLSKAVTYQNNTEVVCVDYTYPTDSNNVYVMTTESNGISNSIEVHNTYTEKGNLLKVEQYQDNTLVLCIQYSYDQHNNILTRETKSIKTGNTTLEYYTYNADNTKSHYEKYIDSNLTLYSDFAYFDDGSISSTSNYQNGIGLISYVEFIYEDNTQTEFQYTKEMDLLSKAISTYDECGNLILYEQFNSQDQLMSSIKYLYYKESVNK